jgi:non-ribosomal peptide synthetase component F
MMDMHHLITDAASDVTFINDLVAFYRGEELPPLKLRYRDYSSWQHSEAGQESLRSQEIYWLDRFAGEKPVLNIPTDYPRPGHRDYRGDAVNFALGEELSRQLNELSGKTGATTYMILLSVFIILLSKYSQQEDITVGSPVSARRHIDLENIIGIFVNMLALRHQPRGHKSYREFLQEVKENALKAYENQDYPFNQLAMKLGQQGSMNRNPLFDIVFQLNPEAPPLDETRADAPPGENQLDVGPYPFGDKRCVFDMILMSSEQKEGITLSLVYSTALFRKATCERMTGHFIEIFEQVSRDNDIKLQDISISHRLLSTTSRALQEVVDEEEAFAFEV